MNKFVTSIKTPYTNTPAKIKDGFVTKYKNSGGRTVISGENRGEGKKYTSKFLK